MKKLIIILALISFQSHAQTPEGIPDAFRLANKNIIWEVVFELKEGETIEGLKNNLKLKFNDEGFGTAEELQLDCKGVNMWLKGNFKTNYKIETKDNRYRVTASNFIFEDTMEINFGSVRTAAKTTPLEFYELKDSNGTIRPNNQTQRDMQCLDHQLRQLFTIIPAPNQNW
jgi:hypothetical protein